MDTTDDIISPEVIETEEVKKPHYACLGGCGKTSETIAKCSSIGCWRARNPLAECYCTDGKHAEILEAVDPAYKDLRKAE
jgi:hypothetical protein